MSYAKDRPPPREGPLVPIDTERLRAAIRWSGVKLTTLAAWAVLNQQTLDAMYQSTDPRRRTRAPGRARLARALRCPDKWLGGEGAFYNGPPWTP